MTLTMTQTANRLPLAFKLAYTAFMAVLIPVYWYYYGPTNFLYFCDVALIISLVGIWLETPLLISMCAVGILIPQALWVIDFVAGLFGFQMTGMTAYMFNANSSLFLRGLSLFHGWLPFMLAWLVWKLGYDRRGLSAWIGTTWVLLLVCFFLIPPPRPDPGLTPVNINYVWGMSDLEAQTFMPAYVWLAMMMILLPLIAFVTHLLLVRFAPKAPA
jgi:hypothetical protein